MGLTQTGRDGVDIGFRRHGLGHEPSGSRERQHHVTLKLTQLNQSLVVARPKSVCTGRHHLLHRHTHRPGFSAHLLRTHVGELFKRDQPRPRRHTTRRGRIEKRHTAAPRQRMLGEVDRTIDEHGAVVGRRRAVAAAGIPVGASRRGAAAQVTVEAVRGHVGAIRDIPDVRHPVFLIPAAIPLTVVSSARVNSGSSFSDSRCRFNRAICKWCSGAR